MESDCVQVPYYLYVDAKFVLVNFGEGRKMSSGRYRGRIKLLVLLFMAAVPAAIVLNVMSLLFGGDNAASCQQLVDAAAHGDVREIRSLVRNGADVNCLPDAGWYTPLQTAAESAKEEAVKVLLELGADPDLRDQGSPAAADLAKDKKILLMLRNAKQGSMAR